MPNWTVTNNTTHRSSLCFLFSFPLPFPLFFPLPLSLLLLPCFLFCFPLGFLQSFLAFLGQFRWSQGSEVEICPSTRVVTPVQVLVEPMVMVEKIHTENFSEKLIHYPVYKLILVTNRQNRLEPWYSCLILHAEWHDYIQLDERNSLYWLTMVHYSKRNKLSWHSLLLQHWVCIKILIAIHWQAESHLSTRQLQILILRCLGSLASHCN